MFPYKGFTTSKYQCVDVWSGCVSGYWRRLSSVEILVLSDNPPPKIPMKKQCFLIYNSSKNEIAYIEAIEYFIKFQMFIPCTTWCFPSNVLVYQCFLVNYITSNQQILVSIFNLYFDSCKKVKMIINSIPVTTPR